MPLTTDQIERAALDILNRYGLGDLSMRRIAASLAVAPGGLYWHIENKQRLFINLACRIVTLPEPAGETWSQRLSEWAFALRAQLLKHRDGAELVSSAVALAGPDARLDPAAPARGVLIDAGLSPAESAAAADVMLSFILGQTMTWQAREQFRGIGVTSGQPAPDSFDLGITTILAGLESRIGVPAPDIPRQV